MCDVESLTCVTDQAMGLFEFQRRWLEDFLHASDLWSTGGFGFLDIVDVVVVLCKVVRHDFGVFVCPRGAASLDSDIVLSLSAECFGPGSEFPQLPSLAGDNVRLDQEETTIIAIGFLQFVTIVVLSSNREIARRPWSQGAGAGWLLIIILTLRWHLFVLA